MNLSNALRPARLLLICFAYLATACTQELNASKPTQSQIGIIQGSHFRDGFATTAIAWSPDGHFIATSGTQTRSIHIWNSEKRSLAQDLTLPSPPSARFHNLAWSPDGRFLAICSTLEASLRIYSTSDWTVAKDFGPDVAASCQKPVFSSDSQELTILAFNLITLSAGDWKIKRKLAGATPYRDGRKTRYYQDGWNEGKTINDIAYIPGSHTIVLGGGQYDMPGGVCTAAQGSPYSGRIWLLEPQESILTNNFIVYCVPNGGDIRYLAIHQSGLQMATATRTNSPDANLKILKLPNGRPSQTPLSGLDDRGPGGVAFSPNGKYLIVGEQGSALTSHPIYVIDTESMRLLAEGASGPDIRDLAVSPDNTSFATAGWDGIYLWKLARRQQ